MYIIWEKKLPFALLMNSMDPYQETIKTWNKLAEEYRDRFMDFDFYHGSYDALCSLLPVGARVLELGCGPGVIAKYLLKKRPDLNLLITDGAPNMIKVAKKEVPEAETLVLDVRNLDPLTEQFDAVIAGFLIPYLSLDDLVELIKKLGGRLRSHGWLYVSFVPGDSADSGFISGSSGDRTHFYFHSEETLRNILNNHNFTFKKEWRIPYAKNDGTQETHSIIIAKKDENHLF